MVPNVATWDRIARVVIGLAVLSMMFIGPQTLWGLLGVIPLMSGAAGYCPLYRMLGVSGCAACRTGDHGRTAAS